MAWKEIVNMIISTVSVVGTFGAAAIALYLAIQGNRQRIDCAFMWEAATNDKPMLILNNTGNRTVIVERIDLYFDKKKSSIISEYLDIVELTNVKLLSHISGQAAHIPVIKRIGYPSPTKANMKNVFSFFGITHMQ